MRLRISPVIQVLFFSSAMLVINRYAVKASFGFTGINEIEPIYEPPRPGDVRNSLADVSKAQKLLGYHVQVPFDEGLRRTVAWHKKSIKTGK